MIGFSHYFHPAEAISISTLDTFSRCPRRYFLRYGVGIAKGEHVALKFGEAIHAALPKAFRGELEASVAAFEAVWQGRQGDEKRNSTNGYMILKDYMDSHINGRSIYVLQPPPGNTLLVSEHISEWEIPFVLNIGLSVPLVGRVDCLGTHRDTGKPWGIEWKTSSEMSTRFFEGFVFSPQVCAYTLALRSYGIPVEGVIVEGLKVSSAKKDAQQTLSQPIYVTDYMIDVFLKWARWQGEMLLRCQEMKEFPQNIAACNTYPQFGSPGYQCEYTPMCLSEDWTGLMDQYFPADYPTFRMLGIGQPGNPPLVSLSIGATE